MGGKLCGGGVFEADVDRASAPEAKVSDSGFVRITINPHHLITSLQPK